MTRSKSFLSASRARLWVDRIERAFTRCTAQLLRLGRFILATGYALYWVNAIATFRAAIATSSTHQLEADINRREEEYEDSEDNVSGDDDDDNEDDEEQAEAPRKSQCAGLRPRIRI